MDSEYETHGCPWVFYGFLWNYAFLSLTLRGHTGGSYTDSTYRVSGQLHAICSA